MQRPKNDVFLKCSWKLLKCSLISQIKCKPHEIQLQLSSTEFSQWGCSPKQNQRKYSDKAISKLNFVKADTAVEDKYQKYDNSIKVITTITVRIGFWK